MENTRKKRNEQKNRGKEKQQSNILGTPLRFSTSLLPVRIDRYLPRLHKQPPALQLAANAVLVEGLLKRVTRKTSNREITAMVGTE